MDHRHQILYENSQNDSNETDIAIKYQKLITVHKILKTI